MGQENDFPIPLLEIFPTLPLSFLDAGPIIQASRVNQALCDEAEHGRAHGNGCIVDGCWIFGNEKFRMNLHKGYQFDPSPYNQFGLFDRYWGGDPLIETLNIVGNLMPINGENMWSTQFPYLHASIVNPPNITTFDSFGLSNLECDQARTLGAEWGLTKNWGDKNRLDSDSNWHDDCSTLTTIGDRNIGRQAVLDANGNPQYVIKAFHLDQDILLLPIRYLKRPGFKGPRRVFFPPEENIAIWYSQLPNKNVQTIILSRNAEILQHATVMSNAVIGCLPGGTPSIAKTDITTLHGRNTLILILEKNDRAEVEFAVGLTARLRKEYMKPDIIHRTHGNVSRLSYSELASLATLHDIFVPEELRSEYLGDLTSTIANYTPAPIIRGVMNVGDIINIFEYGMPPLMLVTHLARRFNSGINIFGEFWPVAGKTETLTIIDRECRNIAAKYQISGRIADCSFLDFPASKRQQVFNDLLEHGKLVFIAATELLADHPDICIEIIRLCISKNVGVVIISDAEPVRRLKRVISRSFTVSRTDHPNGVSIALADDIGEIALEASFNKSGRFLSAQLMSEEKRAQIVSGPIAVSSPPDVEKLLDLHRIGA